MLDLLIVCSPSLTLIFVILWDLDQIDSNQGQTEEAKAIVTCMTRAQESDPMEEGLRKVPDLHKDDLAQRRIRGRAAPLREPLSFVTLASMTESDLETWERLKVSGKTRNLWDLCLVLTRDGDVQPICAPEPSPEIKAETALRDDFASRKARAYQKASSPKQKFVHFGPVTEIDQQTWQRLSIGKPGPREEGDTVGHGSQVQMDSGSPVSVASSSKEDHVLNAQHGHRYTCPSCAQRPAWDPLLLLRSLLQHM
ncbi:uncharacterized protein LOC111728722 [Otolemur garnettii]|uniref:uncharacterized protein LOC111728722 n=1 Tax=Otolemur garnettii TaxID=30611 RepID=UPI000C7EEA9F|nr:uncharacterized protein LOC111728722 [Otolemur garnettii]